MAVCLLLDNNYLDLGMNKSGFVHTLPSGTFTWPRGRPTPRTGPARDRVLERGVRRSPWLALRAKLELSS
jgi:hypothetical protein